MAGFRRMADMEMSPEEKVEEMMPSAIDTPRDYPIGLTITLTDKELEKLDCDDDCEVGDMIHLFAMAEVTSVSKIQRDGENSVRIQLQITHLGIEDEDAETEPDED